MNNKNITKLLFIIINLLIFFITLAVLITRVFIGYSWDTGRISGFNYNYLKYFTSLSNFYNGFIALFLAVLSIKNYKKENYVFPKYAKVLYLQSTLGVGLTFLVTVTFLTAITPNPLILYRNELAFFHVVNPVLTIICYIFFFKSEKLSKFELLFSLIPMVLYGIAYIILVPLKIWSDHYGFTFGGHYWALAIVMTVLLIVGYLLSMLFEFLNMKLGSKK